MRVLLSAGAARLARSPVSPSTDSICPLRGRHKEANSKTGKQLQLGRLKVLQARLRLPLLERNSRRETDQTITSIQALRGRASLGRCSHVPTPSVTSGLRSTPGTLQFQASLSSGYGPVSNASMCLFQFGGARTDFRANRWTSVGSWGGGRGYAWGRSNPRSLPSPTASHSSFRPAAVSEIARRPRIH